MSGIATATPRSVDLPRSVELQGPMRLDGLARSIVDLLAAQDERLSQGE
jgi:two-component system, chemotaxis family, CheB/CheR fusion protein